MKGAANNKAEINGLKTSESLLTALNQYQYGTANGFQLSGTNFEYTGINVRENQLSHLIEVPKDL